MKTIFRVITKDGTEEVTAQKVSIDATTAALLFMTNGKLVMAYNPGSWERLEVEKEVRVKLYGATTS